MTKKQTASDWIEHRLNNAINFALNYPREFRIIRHDVIKEVYEVAFVDGDGIGFHHIALTDSYVRNCMNWKGQKAWAEPTDYEDIFSRTHAAAERWKDKNNA